MSRTANCSTVSQYKRLIYFITCACLLTPLCCVSLLSDVWRSSNGISWSMVNDNGLVGWSARYLHGMIAIKNEMLMIFGGSTESEPSEECWISPAGGGQLHDCIS